MTAQEWRAHCEARTIHHQLVMLKWAWRRFILTTGFPQLARTFLEK